MGRERRHLKVYINLENKKKLKNIFYWQLPVGGFLSWRKIIGGRPNKEGVQTIFLTKKLLIGNRDARKKFFENPEHVFFSLLTRDIPNREVAFPQRYKNFL